MVQSVSLVTYLDGQKRIKLEDFVLDGSIDRTIRSKVFQDGLLGAGTDVGVKVKGIALGRRTNSILVSRFPLMTITLHDDRKVSLISEH